MPKEYRTTLHRWFDEVWNEKRESVIEEMLTGETVHYGLGGVDGEPVRGVENFRNFHRAFLAAFPDLNVTVHEVISEGEKLAARFTVRGTHTGDGLGFPSTGRAVEFTGSGICTIRNGKFVEVWNELNFMKMYSQLGVLTLNLQ